MSGVLVNLLKVYFYFITNDNLACGVETHTLDFGVRRACPVVIRTEFLHVMEHLPITSLNFSSSSGCSAPQASGTSFFVLCSGPASTSVKMTMLEPAPFEDELTLSRHEPRRLLPS